MYRGRFCKLPLVQHRFRLLSGDQCNAIHKTILEQFKHAIVYGQSVKHQPQRVGLTHELADEDISKLGKMIDTCASVLTQRQSLLSSDDHRTALPIRQRGRGAEGSASYLVTPQVAISRSVCTVAAAFPSRDRRKGCHFGRIAIVRHI